MAEAELSGAEGGVGKVWWVHQQSENSLWGGEERRHVGMGAATPTLCWASCLLRVCKQRPPVLKVLFFQPAMPVAVSYHSAPFHFPALLPSHPLLLSFPLKVPSRPPPQTLLHRTASQSQIQDSVFHYIRETKNDNET